MDTAHALKRIFQNFLLMLVTLCILFGSLEIITRTFTEMQPNLRQKDSVIGYRYARSTSQEVFDPESGRKVLMRFNSQGFRGPDHSQEKPAGVKRIAILGDSMVAALQVPEENSMVAELEQLLNDAATGERWEVMNFGISGSSPGQSIAVWRNEVQKLDPDIVLFGYFVGNDLANNCKCIDAKTGRIYFDIDADGIYRQQPHNETKTAVSRFLNANSSFYLWQKNAFKTLRHRLNGQIQNGEYIRAWKDGDWVYASKQNKNTKYAWRLSAEALKALDREVSESGAVFAAFTIPHGPQIYADLFTEITALRPEEEWLPLQDNPDTQIFGICKSNQLTCFSLLESFRRAAPNATSTNKKEQLFYNNGNGHFNEGGNAVAAQAVYEFLSDNMIQSPVSK